MSKPDRKPALSVVMSDEVRQVLDDIAKQQTDELRGKGENRKVYAGDVVRDAIEYYLKEVYQKEVDVSVDRGGFRVPVSFGNAAAIQDDPQNKDDTEDE
jgi:hypothetical protein